MCYVTPRLTSFLFYTLSAALVVSMLAELWSAGAHADAMVWVTAILGMVLGVLVLRVVVELVDVAFSTYALLKQQQPQDKD